MTTTQLQQRIAVFAYKDETKFIAFIYYRKKHYDFVFLEHQIFEAINLQKTIGIFTYKQALQELYNRGKKHIQWLEQLSPS
jgi:hypothetical protein